MKIIRINDKRETIRRRNVNLHRPHLITAEYVTSEQDIQLLLNVANLKQVTYLPNNKGELRLDYIAFTIKLSNFYYRLKLQIAYK